MKSFLFKPEIWTAKKKVLSIYGEAVTRRLTGLDEINKEPDKWKLVTDEINPKLGFAVVKIDGTLKYVEPPYTLGEVVYVKEAHKFTSFGFALNAYVEYKDGEKRDVTSSITDGTTVYNQDHPEVHKWRSPLFMPEWAARSFVKIKEIRAERFYFTNLTSHEYNLDGGHASADYLHSIDGQWAWRILFKDGEDVWKLK